MGPLWHLKNACPTCTYILQGEPELRFSLLYMMDGNDSLKRAVRQVEDADKVDGADEVTTQCEELLPGRVLTCDQFLTWEEMCLPRIARLTLICLLRYGWPSL